MFYSITITYYDSKPATMAKYVETSDGDLERYDYPSYADAMRELRQMEKLLGRMAVMDINRYDRDICTKSLHHTRP